MFHARLHDELLNQKLFQAVHETRVVVIEQWRRYLNEDRPYGALNDAAPMKAINQFKTSSSLTMEATPGPDPRRGFSQQVSRRRSGLRSIQFWLGHNLILQGRGEEAHELFGRVVGFCQRTPYVCCRSRSSR